MLQTRQQQHIDQLTKSVEMLTAQVHALQLQLAVKSGAPAGTVPHATSPPTHESLQLHQPPEQRRLHEAAPNRRANQTSPQMPRTRNFIFDPKWRSRCSNVLL
jgi:hypothetical protein